MYASIVHRPRQFADKIKSAVSHSGRPLPFFDNVYYVVLPVRVDLPGFNNSTKNLPTIVKEPY